MNTAGLTEPAARNILLPGPSDHSGNFRTQCTFSHLAYDDPIVFPGQPGRAHLHMFFGNTLAQANTTFSSLRNTGSSSCNGFELNRTAYWAPAVIDRASATIKIPNRLEIYYKTHSFSQDRVQSPPQGLGMLPAPAASNPFVTWACQITSATGRNLQSRQNTIPNCSSADSLVAWVRFPQCVRSTATLVGNVEYSEGGYYSGRCPSGTVLIPSIEYFLIWNPGTHAGSGNNWFLSSDVKAGAPDAPDGSTLHADWMNGWNQTALDQIHVACWARLADCNWDIMGSRQLARITHFGASDPAFYDGPYSIPISQTRGLCPSDPITVVTDVAVCNAGVK